MNPTATADPGICLDRIYRRRDPAALLPNGQEFIRALELLFGLRPLVGVKKASMFSGPEILEALLLHRDGKVQAPSEQVPRPMGRAERRAKVRLLKTVQVQKAVTR